MQPLKAETVLAVQLTIRHRTVRLVGLLAALVIVVGLSGGSTEGGGTVLLVASSVAAVAASRVLAPGAAIHAAHRAAAPWWLVPAGRLMGVFILVLAVTLAATVLGVREWPAGGVVALIATTYAMVTASAVMALAPGFGASAAGGMGLLAVWVGAAPPSVVAGLTERWGSVQHGVVLAWNTLPLGWRAVRWLERGGLDDLPALLAWFGLAFLLACWSAARWGYTLDARARA